MSAPPLGPEVPIVDRRCTRDVAWPEGVLCGEESVLHVAWEWGAGACGFVCERHTRELTAKGWKPVQQHEVGPDCGMPNAVWDEDENRCYVPDDPESSESVEMVPASSVAGSSPDRTDTEGETRASWSKPGKTWCGRLNRGRLRQLPRDTYIHHGGANGADDLAADICDELGIPQLIVLPNYAEDGRHAPHIRNDTMLDEADLVLAFWDGTSRGTASVIEKARRRGIPVEVFGGTPPEVNE